MVIDEQTVERLRKELDTAINAEEALTTLGVEDAHGLTSWLGQDCMERYRTVGMTDFEAATFAGASSAGIIIGLWMGIRIGREEADAIRASEVGDDDLVEQRIADDPELAPYSQPNIEDDSAKQAYDESGLLPISQDSSPDGGGVELGPDETPSD